MKGISRVDRKAEITRNTKETQVYVELNLDQPGGGSASTGHGFLDHIIFQLIQHGKLQLSIKAKGDLHVDVHHLVEDVGITLGQAVKQALGNNKGIERYADAWIPMDETLAQVVIDISGRPFIAFEPSGYEGDANGFNVHHLRELLRGFCNHAGINIHVRVLSGSETHHVCEAVFKAFARALYQATRVTSEALPSTKGVI